MKNLFLLAFGSGLAIAVYSMLHGVERTRNGARHQPSPHLNLPALATFATVFGATGYLLFGKSDFSTGAILTASILAGVAAWLAFTVLMAKWALGREEPPDLEAEEIQGRPAIVVGPVLAGMNGTIRYERDGRQVECPARSIDAAALHAGSEVVIERFDNEVAIIEAWSSVEKRL